MFEARRVLEVGIPDLAAEWATVELGAMGDEVVALFASPGAPSSFLRDVRFHRAVALGCGNSALGAIVELVLGEDRAHHETPPGRETAAVCAPLRAFRPAAALRRDEA